jgi:hypothetical protein
MTVDVVPEPVTRDKWLTARVNGHVEVAAYIPADLQGGRAPLSVFWRGQIDRHWLGATVDYASALWRDLLATYDVKAVAFGERQKTITHDNLGDYLAASQELDKFSAYRVDFALNTQSGPAEMAIWANVAESDQRSLEEGGENVGVAVSAGHFDPSICKFISHTITKTRQVEQNTIVELLGAISKNIDIGVRRIGA